MVDYSYYTGIYYGDKVENEVEFTKLARKAESQLNTLTFGRYNKIDELPRGEVDKENLKELLRITLCEVVDLYASSYNNDGISSKSIADISISYESKDKDFLSLQSEIRNLIQNNLSRTGLTYWGLD